MNAGLDIFCHRLLGALVNGGYQGLGITAVVWFGLKVFPRVNAATRHMVLLITLLLVVALPVAHYFLPNREGTLVNLSVVDSPAEAQALKAGVPSVSAESRHAWSQEDLRPRLVEEAPRVEAEVFFSDNSALARPDLESPWPRFRNDTEPEVPQAAVVGRTVAEFSTASDPGHDRGAEFLRWLASGSRNWQFSLPDHLGIALVGLWCLLTFLRLGLLAWQCRWLHFLKRRSLPASDALNRQFRTLAEEMRVKRKPRLLMCPENTAPMAVGFWEPAVLLPAKAFEDVPDLQLGHVLRHELAHVRRRDDWANLVQQAVKAVLFFHPAVHWLSRRLTVEREIACDDHVLAATHTPRSYALFLTEFAGRRQGHVVVAAPAAWSSQNQLTERINMILDVNRNSSPRLARLRLGILTAGATWIAVLGLTTGPRLVFAQENANNNPSLDQSAEVSTQVAEDSALPPATTESGPRQKRHRAQQVAPAVAPAPDPQPIEVPRPRVRSRAPAMIAPPTAPGRPTPYAIAAALPADAQPATPPKLLAASAPRQNASDDSIERRLERLEQMVQSLMAREQVKKRTEAGHDFHLDLKGPMFDQARDKETHAKIAAEHAKAAGKHPKFEYQEEELDRVMEKASRDVERAERDAQRAAKDLERAALEKQRPEADERAAAAQAQTWQSAKSKRKALEAQRKALEKQMEAVQRQLQRLHEDQDENNLDEQEDKVKDKVKDKAKRLEKDRDSVNSDDPNELEKP